MAYFPSNFPRRTRPWWLSTVPAVRRFPPKANPRGSIPSFASRSYPANLFKPAPAIAAAAAQSIGVPAAVVVGTLNTVANIEQNPQTTALAYAAGLGALASAPASLVSGIGELFSGGGGPWRIGGMTIADRYNEWRRLNGMV